MAVDEAVQGSSPDEKIQHCLITKKNGQWRIQFKVETATVLAFELSPFQFRLMCEALAAGSE
jgi:hypothetical protein